MPGNQTLQRAVFHVSLFGVPVPTNYHEIANGLPQLVAQRPEMEEIVSVVARVFSVSREEILEKRRGRQPVSYTHLTLPTILLV